MREQVGGKTPRIRVYRAWPPSMDVEYKAPGRGWAWRVWDEHWDVLFRYPTWEAAWQGARVHAAAARRAAAARVRAKGAGDE